MKPWREPTDATCARSTLVRNSGTAAGFESRQRALPGSAQIVRSSVSVQVLVVFVLFSSFAQAADTVWKCESTDARVTYTGQACSGAARESRLDRSGRVVATPETRGAKSDSVPRPARAGAHPDAPALMRAGTMPKPHDASGSAECKAAVREYESEAAAGKDAQRMEATRLEVNIACGTMGGGEVPFVKAGTREKLAVCGSAYEKDCRRATGARP